MARLIEPSRFWSNRELISILPFLKIFPSRYPQGRWYFVERLKERKNISILVFKSNAMASDDSAPLRKHSSLTRPLLNFSSDRCSQRRFNRSLLTPWLCPDSLSFSPALCLTIVSTKPWPPSSKLQWFNERQDACTKCFTWASDKWAP